MYGSPTWCVGCACHANLLDAFTIYIRHRGIVQLFLSLRPHRCPHSLVEGWTSNEALNIFSPRCRALSMQ